MSARGTPSTWTSVTCPVRILDAAGDAHACGGELEIEWTHWQAWLDSGEDAEPDVIDRSEILSVRTWCFHCPTLAEAKELLDDVALAAAERHAEGRDVR